jgi:hypothetical protein
MCMVLATILMPKCNLNCVMQVPREGDCLRTDSPLDISLHADMTPVQEVTIVQQLLKRCKRATPQDDRPT